ncbi:WXG100 family type VII secretion target [Mycolicibacter minnesotensis]
MADIIRVQVEALAGQSKNATDAAEEIGQRLAGLRTRMDSLAGTWTGGTAARAYLDVWEEISDECRDMIEDLSWIGNSLSAAASAYTDMEHSAVQAFHEVNRPASGGGL